MQVSEKELEDWVCDNIKLFTEDDDVELIGRQIKLPSGGILDVLAASWDPWSETAGQLNLTIIELKADQVCGKAVTQLLSYMGAVQKCVDGARETFNARYEPARYPPVGIHGILGGLSLSSEAGWCLEYLDSVRFVRLHADIGCEGWWNIQVPGSDTHVPLKDNLLDLFPGIIPARYVEAEKQRSNGRKMTHEAAERE